MQGKPVQLRREKAAEAALPRLCRRSAAATALCTGGGLVATTTTTAHFIEKTEEGRG